MQTSGDSVVAGPMTYLDCHWIPLPDGMTLCVGERNRAISVGFVLEGRFFCHNPYGPAFIGNPWRTEEVADKIRTAITSNKMMSDPGSMHMLFDMAIPSMIFNRHRTTKEWFGEIWPHLVPEARERTFKIGEMLLPFLDDDYQSFFKTLQGSRELTR